MGNRTSIGIYIGAGDKDIAAWFNLLARNNMSRSKWVRALLAAYSLRQPLRIGVIDKRAPLIRDKDDPRDTISSSDLFKYGWHIRGPNREFVIGSVVNISIRNDEIKETLDEAWANGHMLAPFIKSLIRKNLKIGDQDIPPKLDEFNRIWAEYLVSVNSRETKRKREDRMAGTANTSPEEPDINWIAGDTEGTSPAPAKVPQRHEEKRGGTKASVPKPDRSFTFLDGGEEEGGEQPSAPKAEPVFTPPSPAPAPNLSKNPLLSQI